MAVTYKDWNHELTTYDQRVVNVYPYTDYKLWASIKREDAHTRWIDSNTGLNNFPHTVGMYYYNHYGNSSMVIEKLIAKHKEWKDTDGSSSATAKLQPIQWVRFRQFDPVLNTGHITMPTIDENDPIMIKNRQTTSDDSIYVRLSLNYAADTERSSRMYITQWKVSLVKPDETENATNTYTSNGFFANDMPSVEHYEFCFNCVSLDLAAMLFAGIEELYDVSGTPTFKGIAFGYMRDKNFTIDGINDSYIVLMNAANNSWNDAGGYTMASRETEVLSTYLEGKSYQEAVDSFASGGGDYATKEYVRDFCNKKFVSR